MERKLTSGLILKVVDLPIPILRNPKWVEVGYPKKLQETKLIKLLKQSLAEIKKFAQATGVKQIKVSTDPSWARLTELGLIKTVYYLTINTTRLAKILVKRDSVVDLKEPGKIKNLIEAQFIYHCQYKPEYFTCEIKDRVGWFINLVKENLRKKEGFLLGAKINKELVGFIYGEFYKDEGCVDELFVEEKSRGKGLGKLLMKEGGKRFLTKNLPITGLFVGVDEKSLGFYEKLGFERQFVNWIKNL